MKHEFWAEFDLYPLAVKEKQKIIDGFVTNKKFSKLLNPWNQVTDCSARQQILAQLLASEDKCTKKLKCKDYAKEKIIQWYYAEDLENPRGNYQKFLCKRLRWMGDILNLINNHDTAIPSLPDISIFPSGSWAIQVHFTLRKPYLSKDDVDFYIVDNPVKKEWVFKVPYVAPSQWKGALRAAMLRQLEENLRSKKVDEEGFTHERLRLYRLFGNEKDGTAEFLNQTLTLHRVGPRPENEHQAQKWEERYKQTFKQVALEFEEKVRAEGYRKENVEGFQGRLHFYPTFFDHIGLEVINPHPRDTGAGKNPIYFECVPAGTPGVFTLLYVPLDAGPKDADTIKTDLHAVACGVCAMLTQNGFGAKTSSGYGVVESKVKIRGEPEKQRKEFERIWKENCSTHGGKQDE